MVFVLDASVAFAWVFEDEVSSYAEYVLSRLEHETALVPALWPLEIASGLLVAERRGRLTAAEFSRSLELAQNLTVEIRETRKDDALSSVIRLAARSGLTAYDAAYLHLALAEAVPLATLDERLRRAATSEGVELLGHP